MRELIGELFYVIINCTLTETLRMYVDDMVSIARALAMDPYSEVMVQVDRSF